MACHAPPPKPTLEWGVAVTTEVYGEGLVVGPWSQ